MTAAQSAAVIARSEQLSQAYINAWRKLEAQQKMIMGNPRLASQSGRLNELLRSVEIDMSRLDDTARAWIQKELPIAYQSGLMIGSAGRLSSWAASDAEAVRRLAGGMYDDLLSATQHVRSSTKVFIREAAQRVGLATGLQGQTALQAAREFELEMKARRITAVTYRDGSRHGLGEYGRMVTRTTTAQAHNGAVVSGAQQAGVAYLEVFDGPDCGWESHDSFTSAMGKIVTPEEAASYPIAHPGCRRAFGARPDITDPDDAEPFTTQEQAQAQIDQDVVFGRMSSRDAERAQRRLRDPRAPRSSRTLRRQLASPEDIAAEWKNSGLGGGLSEAAKAGARLQVDMAPVTTEKIYRGAGLGDVNAKWPGPKKGERFKMDAASFSTDLDVVRPYADAYGGGRVIIQLEGRHKSWNLQKDYKPRPSDRAPEISASEEEWISGGWFEIVRVKLAGEMPDQTTRVIVRQIATPGGNTP